MTTSNGTASPKKRRVGRIIAVVIAVLIVPLLVGYFVATSEWFFKRVILPQVGASLDSDITVSDASIKPFSQVVLKNLTVHPHGKEPLLKANEVRLRYSLRDIIGGKITVHEVTVDSPVITLVEEADKSSNLDPIAKEDSTRPEAKKSEEPLNLNIRNITLKNATVRSTKNLEGGGGEVTEISNLNFSIDQLINEQPGKMILAGDLRVENTPPASATNTAPGSMRGKLDGGFDYKLTAQAEPESAKGNLRFNVLEATGEMAELAKLTAVMNCDLTLTEIRDLSLRFEQAGQSLGELSASGPFSLAKTEGNLKVNLSKIDRQILNLFGTPMGFDFNDTLINSSNEIVISQSGAAISVNGQLNANKVSLTDKAKKQTTPVLELQAVYQLTADQNAQSALIQKFNVNGTQNQQKILTASISKPMPIAWGGTNTAPEEATLQLAITDLNLADWKAFASDLAPSGRLNTTLNVLSQQGGNRLSLDLASRISEFSATIGSNQVSNADVELNAKAAIADMKTMSLSALNGQLAQGGEAALKFNGSGTVDLESKDADLKISANGILAQFFKVVVVPDVSATAGTMKFDGQMTQKGESQIVKGAFALANFSGVYDGSPLDRFGVNVDADLDMQGQNLQIRTLSGTLQQAGQPGGSFDAKGKYNLETKIGDLKMNLVKINQNALRPFLAETLGDKQLVSISVNGNTTAYLQGESSSFKGNIDVKNLVVRDPKKKEDDAPLSAQIQLDAAMRKEVLDLTQFQLNFSPTARAAKNQLKITGQLDLSNTNATRGNLLVQSDSFDVTPFYDLYAAQPQSTNASATRTQPVPQPTPDANEEPEPMNLGVEQILAEINIAQFYLREIEIKNWRGTAKIEGNRVALNPFQMALNGAPIKVNADLDLGVKGYAYDLSATFDKVSLEPLANSFMPESKGAYQGIIIASANIKGRGTTGVNLKKSLTGNADLVFTNANIQIVGKRLKPFLSGIAFVLRAPELTASPINWTASNLKFGNGNIELQNFQMQSDAFTADMKGIIPIADVLTNSPIRKLPINFGLKYSLARKLQLTSSGTPTNAAYVMLPSFLSAGGTLGDPKPIIDKTKLLGGVLEKLGGKIPGVDEKTGNLIQGLGGLLGGKPAQQPTNQTTTTNRAGATNQPAATNNAAPQTNSRQQLIEGFLDSFKKKK